MPAFSKCVLRTMLAGMLLSLSLPFECQTAQAAKPKSESAISWGNVNDFVYQIQNENLTNLGNTKFDLVIMDAAVNGSDDQGFRTAKEIQALKNSPGGPKLVLAYVSIGEAEVYRNYWKKEWDKNNDGKPDKGAPKWLGPAIYPEWPDNYAVQYWEPEWQEIILQRVDGLIKAGFDGIYMDRIDTFEYYMPGGSSKLNRKTAERDMIDFVKKIASRARVTNNTPEFGIFPQGGFSLGDYPDYVAVCTGIGNEDNWYTDNSKNPPADTKEILLYLDKFKKAGKLVLVTDYVRRANTMTDFYTKARAKGYVPYATVRDLNKIIINKGYEPD